MRVRSEDIRMQRWPLSSVSSPPLPDRALLCPVIPTSPLLADLPLLGVCKHIGFPLACELVCPRERLIAAFLSA